MEPDIVIKMLAEEVAFRRSPELYTLYQILHHDKDGDPMSTTDGMEMFIQYSLLKKYGFDDSEKNRNLYLTRCHSLKDDPRVIAIDPPHILHNPYYTETKLGEKFDTTLRLKTADGKDITVNDLIVKDRKLCIITASTS
jgi:hypothetical protein